MIDPGTILACVQTCASCIAFIVQTCDTYGAARAEVVERIAIVENAWTRTRIQFKFIEPLGPILDAEHHRVLEDVIGILAAKLSSAVRKLESVLPKQKNGADVELRPGWFHFSMGVRRGKYVFLKDSLDEVIQDMEEWQRRFDPSWFLIMRMANPIIDQQLTMQYQGDSQGPPVSRSPAQRPAPSPPSQQQHDRHNQSFTLATRLQTAPSPLSLADGLRTALRPDGPHRSVFLPRIDLDFLPIPYCNAKAARRISSDRWFLVDRLTCRPTVDVNVMTRDVRALAQKLTHADPLTFNLFQCKGVMRITDPSRPSHILAFDLVFFIPDGMEIPQSLRQTLLLSPVREGVALSITRRVRIAQELARSVSYVHTFNFVHKNISPESVLLLEDLETSRSATFLVGFDRFRSTYGDTVPLGDPDWDRNIYRHPARQGEYPNEAYRMQHDIYSLGVCLLEIGLWESFVDYPSDTPVRGGPFRDFPARMMQPTGSGLGSNISRGAVGDEAKRYMEDLARTKLLQTMGERYSRVVLSCLTCLDEDNEFFGSDVGQATNDPGGIRLSVFFNEIVLEPLNEIVV
ncbi:hypothetical protein NW765_017746 [Fusarium oxysporum]|nr:hypothetical protein NW765_017746 [Fusarium oxysporum]KAJ4264717.1 hypothetical protein NW764_015802 [Fusarium oxysporum]